NRPSAGSAPFVHLAKPSAAIAVLLFACGMRGIATAAQTDSPEILNEIPLNQDQPKQSSPSDMVLIPGGNIELGINAADIPRYQGIFGIAHKELFNDEIPKHTVNLGAYYLDQNLVTNAQFFAFTRRFPDEDPDEKLKRLNQPFTKEDPRSRYGDHKI